MARIITFEEFLLEAKQVGILYHYTGSFELENILNENILKKSTKKYIKGISFTRNKNFHKVRRAGIKTTCRIVIDGDKLSNNYIIKPYNDFNELPSTRLEDPTYVESEELIVTNEIKDLDKYVIEYQILGILDSGEESVYSKIMRQNYNNNKIKILKNFQ